MTKTEKFLQLYKDYESVLRSEDITTTQYEESLKSDTKKSERLRFCRMLRNYATHNNDMPFVEITDIHIKFLASIIDELKTREDVVKKHLKTPAAGMCTTKDKCVDVIKKMSKLKVINIPVVTPDGYKIANIFDVAEKVAETKTGKISDIKMSKDIAIVSPTCTMDNLPFASAIVCTSDGTPNGKLLGVCYR